jgi:hypothetical protein
MRQRRSQVVKTEAYSNSPNTESVLWFKRMKSAYADRFAITLHITGEHHATSTGN